jgi:hypothetical protein
VKNAERNAEVITEGNSLSIAPVCIHDLHKDTVRADGELGGRGLF